MRTKRDTENRTVKVTGFSLRPFIRRQLSELFTRVAQVEKVVLSPDKNAAFVRFEFKTAVQFAVQQEWLLKNETLMVYPAVAPRDGLSPVRPSRPTVCSEHPVAEVTSTRSSYNDYLNGKNQLWFDFPQERYGSLLPCRKKKKKKRFSEMSPGCTGCPKVQNGKRTKGKSKKKKKKKKGSAYLESFAPIPFGVSTVSSCSPPSSERQIFIKGLTSTVTVPLTKSMTSGEVWDLVADTTKIPSQFLHVTVGGRALSDAVMKEVESGCTLHCSVKGLGGADSQSKDQTEETKKMAEDLNTRGKEMYNKQEYDKAVSLYTASIAVFPFLATYSHRAESYGALKKWKECIEDCCEVVQKDPENFEARLLRAKAFKSIGDLEKAQTDLKIIVEKGPASSTKDAEDILEEIVTELSVRHSDHICTELKVEETPGEKLQHQNMSKSARKRLRKKLMKTGQEGSSSPVLEKTDSQPPENQADVDSFPSQASDQISKDDSDGVSISACSSESSIETQRMIVKGAGDASTFLQSVPVLEVKETSSCEEVMSWFLHRCGIASEFCDLLKGIDGKVLFAFEDNVAKLVEYTTIPIGVARKIVFLRNNPNFRSQIMAWNTRDVLKFIQTITVGQNLSKLVDRHIDGPAFLSYETEIEIGKDFSLKKLIAFQIFIKRNDFLDKEKTAKNVYQSSSENEDPEKSTYVPQQTESIPETMVEGACVQIVHSTVGTVGTDATLNLKSTWLDKNDPLTTVKLFLQNKLFLQPVRTLSGSDGLKRCELRVIFHKRKNLNKLEGEFLFLILCKPDFCQGRAAKDAYTKLWKMIKDNVTEAWKFLLPTDISKNFVFEGSRIQYENKTISFDDEPAKLLSIMEFQKTVRKLDQYSTPVLIIDKQLLEKKAYGYHLTLKLDKKTEKYAFKFSEDSQYWFFSSSDFAVGFSKDHIPVAMTGNLQRIHYTDVADDSSASSNTEKLDQQENFGDGSENHDIISVVENVSNESKAVLDEGFHDQEPVNIATDTDSDDRLQGLEMNDQSSFLAPELVFIPPRPFERGPWRYGKGQLRAIESGDNMLLRAVELKFQAGCVSDSPEAWRSFLYKSLEFTCACLNARKNGTIYFGIAEERSGEHCFRYGEICGIEMDQSLCSKYYETFTDVFLEQCFPDNSKVVKACITGPLFIPIKETSMKYVIEIDIKPSFPQTKSILFRFDPNPIFEKFGTPKKSEKHSHAGNKEKHIYLKNQNNWTGIFYRDGTQTKYIGKSEKDLFVIRDLPMFAAKRQQEEQQEMQTHSSLMKSPEAEKLKTFMGECDTSMFPILVLPKLSDIDKKNNITSFEFLHHIRWSAVFDFDNESEKNGLYSIAKSTNLAFEIHESVASDFGDMSVEERKDVLSFLTKTVWLFTNGKVTGNNAFDRLGHKAWKNSYWTYIQNAVTFYKDNSVIPPARRLVLILIADNFDDGILEASQDIKTAFGWNTVLFVFNSESARAHFAEELSDDIKEHSVVMPWHHVYHVICQCLNLKSQDKDKYVCTSSGALVPIPLNEWQSWKDLDVLNVKECLEDWEGLSKHRRDTKANEEESKFYQGKPVSWWNFFLTDYAYNQVMKRSDLPKILDHVEDKIRITDKNSDKVPIVNIGHMRGAGGTTLGRNILWELKKKYKCAVLKRITVDTERQVTQFWETVEGEDRSQFLPVILLADNLPSEAAPLSEYDLCGKLYRKQKELQLVRPLAILILCHRTMGPEGMFSMLTQKLTPEERTWMERKSKTLEEQQCEGIETFIGFLAMRQEFDQDFLQNTITDFLDRKVLYENERELIEFVSLVTTYFPLSEGSPGLPVTSCDDIMRTYDSFVTRKLPWEKTLSKGAKIILTIDYQYDAFSPRWSVRIASQPYARAILDTVLRENREDLGVIVLRCLESSLVSSSSHSYKKVSEVLSKMLIERQFEEDSTFKTTMSPLIMDIKAKDFNQAVQVLQLGYKKMKNEVFNQQLARLYMSDNQLDKAREFAQLAVQLSPDKRDFKHTLGMVHLRRFTAKQPRRMLPNQMDSKEITECLKIAYLALTNFIAAQGKSDDGALSICYAYHQTIDIVNKVLFFLLDLTPQEELFKVGKFLTEDDFLEYPFFDDLDEKEKKAMKGLLLHGIKALQFLFYLTHSHSFGKSGVSYQVNKDVRTMETETKICEKQMSTLATNVGKLQIQNRFTSRCIDITREDNAKRFTNVKLKGCFFESIFLQFKFLHRDRQKKAATLNRFREIKTNLDNIHEMSFSDIDNFLTVSLAIQIAGVENAFTGNRSKIYKLCDRIIISNLEPSDPRFMRAHLYRVLISWPQEPWEGFNEDDFRKSFHKKSPTLMHRKEPLLPKVHFFVTKESQEFYLCHWTDIYGDVEKEAPSTEMSRLLKSFTGKYKFRKKPDGEQFSSIEMEWKCAVGELRLTVYKIRGIKVFRQERVEFYLGFCLHGPVAFIHNVLPSVQNNVD